MAEQFLRQLDAAELTDVGLVRQKNEDTSKMLIPPPGADQEAMGALFMVIDGMGGLGGGDVASRYAVAEIARHYYTHEDGQADPAMRLQAALQSASEVVRDQAPRLGLPRIGATGAGIVLTLTGDVVVFNVGDARVYLIRDGEIDRVSRDQSVTEREILEGMSEERAAQGGRSSMVTAFIGQPVPLEPVLFDEKAQNGDVFVICSDGLWSLVEAREIVNAVGNNSAQVAVSKLIKLALSRGAPDNVTVIVVRIGKKKKKRGAGGFLRRLAAALIFAVLLTVGYIGYTTLNRRAVGVAAAATPTLAVSATSAVASTQVSVGQNASPTTTLTRSPSPTSTVTPTATTASTNTPVPTNTTQPTNTPEPTDTDMPTETSVPLNTPTVDAAMVIQATPTLTPNSRTKTAIARRPTATLTPTDGPPPTITVNPFIFTYTPTARRTRTPVPTRTLTPTATPLASKPYRVTTIIPIDAYSCPRINCAVVVALARGQVVEVVDLVDGSTVPGREGTKWYKIRYQNRFVFVHSSHLEPVEPTPIPASPTPDMF
jgi:serine/threonine protein phosphatase PrpC